LIALAWSRGKDSTATAILAKEHDLKLDKIVTVMPDPFKREKKFVKKFEDKIGIDVTVIDGPKFEDYFFMKKTSKSKYEGTIYGWPFTAYKTCARVMKWQPMKLWAKKQTDEVKFILGIAYGENRNIQTGDMSYLKHLKYTEKMCYKLCEEHDLLNPLYKYFDRLGCVRCPKQHLDSLRIIKELEPEKWKWCLDHDHMSPVRFKPDYTFKEVDNIIRTQKNLDDF
jgi:tRNA(Ile)-lysidine synthase TilS/MesJ